MNCELCKNERKTRRWYEDNLIWIVDCATCHVPMGVIRRHTKEITQEEYDKLSFALAQVGAKVFGGGNFEIDRTPGKIPDHLHWHARKIKGK